MHDRIVHFRHIRTHKLTYKHASLLLELLTYPTILDQDNYDNLKEKMIRVIYLIVPKYQIYVD